MLLPKLSSLKSVLGHQNHSRDIHATQICSVGSKEMLGFCFVLMGNTATRPLGG